MVAIVYDAKDFWRLSKAFGRLPAEIKAIVTTRAMSRVASMGATRVVRRVAERVDLPSGMVRERTRAYEGGGQAVISVRSNWIPLYKIGARQTARGVSVKARGSYAHAFIAGMRSGHAGVFLRAGKARLPIHELFGPNPAHDITNHPDVYQLLIDDVAEAYVMPRMMHELSRVLPH